MLAIASGRSANSSAIAAPSLSQASGDEVDPVGAFDIGRIGDAQHRIVRGVEARVGVSRRVGRDQRQVARISEVDQRLFRGLLDRIVARATDLDVEPVGKQRLKPVQIGFGLVALPFGEQPRERAFAPRQSARSGLR